MNTHERIDKLTEELREIYKTNEGPRLIAEMVAREFPESLILAASPEYDEMTRQIEELNSEVSTLMSELDDAERRIDELETEDRDD